MEDKDNCTMNSKNIDGVDVFYNEKENCPVIGLLKNGQLYGTGNADLLNKLLISDGYVLDCGGHIGTFALPMSKSRRVVCIEGSESNLQCLKKTFANNKDVVVEGAILSDLVKKCGFNDDGAFGCIKDGDSYETNTIDNICSKYPQRVAGIKLDIEGGELEALDGAKETLSKYLPPILIEINGWCLYNRQMKPQDLISKVNDFGYEVFMILGDNIKLINSEDKFPMCVCDVICIHRSKRQYYNLENVISLSKDEIDGIITYMYERSNCDCKIYFDSIKD